MDKFLPKLIISTFIYKFKTKSIGNIYKVKCLLLYTLFAKCQ